MSLMERDELVTAGPGGAGGDLPEERMCCGCHLVLPIEDFGVAKLGRWGRRPRCRECVAKDRRRYEAQRGPRIRRKPVIEPRLPREPRPPVERHPDIPPRPKLPGKLSDDQLLTLIFRDSGGGYVHTSELAYQSGVRGPWKLAEQTERLRLAGFVAEGRPAEWTVTDAGVEHLRGLAR